MFNIQIDEDWGYQFVPEIDFEPDIVFELKIPPGLMGSCEWKQGAWRNVHELDLVLQAVKDLSREFGPGDTGAQVFRTIYDHVLISRWKTDPIPITSFAPPGNLADILGDVVLPDYTFDHADSYAQFEVVHELGHVWDYRSGNQLSFGLMVALHSWVCGANEAHSNQHCWDPAKSLEPPPDATRNCTLYPHGAGCPQGQKPYSQTYGMPVLGRIIEGPGWEDWAQSLAYYVYRSYDLTTYGLESIRRNYVEEQIRAARLP